MVAAGNVYQEDTMTHPKATWLPVSAEYPPERVQCFLLTTAGQWKIGYRLGNHWYLPKNGRLPFFMVTHVIIPERR